MTITTPTLPGSKLTKGVHEVLGMSYDELPTPEQEADKICEDVIIFLSMAKNQEGLRLGLVSPKDFRKIINQTRKFLNKMLKERAPKSAKVQLLARSLDKR